MANNQASDLIEAAINQAMKSNEEYDEGDLLIEWVLVSYTANADEEKGSAYPMFLSNGNMPTYRVRGLLETGLIALQDTFKEED